MQKTVLDPATRLNRRLRTWVLLGAAGFALLLTGILTLELREAHDAVLRAAELRGRNESLLLARTIEGAFNEADFVLRDVIGHMRDSDIRFPDTQPAHYQAIRNLLREKTLSLPYIYGIGIADKDCVVSYAAREEPGLDISRRPYCTALKDDPERDVFISGVYMGQQNFLQLTRGRKIRNAEGKFAGIGLMRIDMSFFGRFLLDVDVGQHGSAAVADTDLRLAGRKPERPDKLGKTIDDPVLRQMLADSLTFSTYRQRSPIDGRERLYTARKLTGLPLVVVLGIDCDEILTEWRAQARWAIAALVILLSLLALTTRQYLVSLRQSDVLAWQSAAMDASGDSIIITTAQGLIEYVNPAFLANTGYTVSEVIGQRPSLLKSGRDPAALHAELWRTILSGQVWHGELINRRRDGSLYTDLVTISPLLDPQGHPQRFVAVQHDITERKRMEERLAALAQYDELTGLPNRRLFEDRLTRAIAEARRDGSAFALLFIDLDGFKAVNDDCGHDAGDSLLAEVGQRLAASLRDADTLGRLGGDEFVALLHGTSNGEHARQVAEKMIRALCERFDVGGFDCHVGASIGVAQFPDDGGSAELLMKHADLAMYAAKRRGKNCCVLAAEVI